MTTTTLQAARLAAQAYIWGHVALALLLLVVL
jgi:hypothetical protein